MTGNVSGNLYNFNTTTRELKTEPPDMMFDTEEITVTKIEVREEEYDFEMPLDCMEFDDIKGELSDMPEAIIKEENLEFVNDTEHSLNEKLEIENVKTKEDCGSRVLNSQNNKYSYELCDSTFNKMGYLKSLHQQRPADKKITKECTRLKVKNIRILHEKQNGDDSMMKTPSKVMNIAGAKKYKCNYCEYVTPWRHCLVVHRSEHNAKKPFKCTYKNCKCAPGQTCQCAVCGFACALRCDLNSHILKKHYTKPRTHSEEPKKNEYVTYRKDNLVIHIHNHSDEKQFKCTYKNCKCERGQVETCECEKCEFATSSLSNLHKHALENHSREVKQYKCNNCKYITHNKEHLMVHRCIHLVEKPFKCTYKDCKCTPEQEEACQCKKCGFASALQSDLNNHILLRHCTEPRKPSTYRKDNLMIHIRNYSGEKFKCTYRYCDCEPGQVEACECEQCAFTTRSYFLLNKHMEAKHSEELNRYTCDYCSYATHNKVRLMIHSRIHMGEKPFKCTYKGCKCAPGQNESCECNMCEFASANKYCLKKHVLAMHSNQRS